MSAQPLKIGFVLDTSLDPVDGVQQYVTNLGEWLRAHGHDVHYLVGQTSKRNLPNIHSLCRNISVTFNGNKTTIPLWISHKKARGLRAEKFDILHVQTPHHPFMSQRIIKAANPETAVIGTFHILPYGWVAKVSTGFLGWILKPSLKRFDQMLAVSTSAARFEETVFKIPAQVCPNVVELTKFRDAVRSAKHPSSSKKTIVFLGRLVPRKGALQLLEAVAALPKPLQDSLSVKIGGKGELLSRLEEYAEQANIATIVSFEGFIPESSKAAFLNQADVAVFPSTSGESFGIVLLEAMAAKAGVVLGGNNPGYSTVLSAWPKTLFDPDDVAAFAKTLEFFLTNEIAARKLHVEQQQAVEQYDIDLIGERMVSIYQNAIAKRRRKMDNKSK